MIRLTPFWRNVTTVLGGTVVAQIIPLSVLPLLTRIFSAEQLGVYFVWFGAVTVLTVVATARLDMAVFVARSEEEVNQLLQSVIVISVGVAAVSFIGAICYKMLSSRPFLIGGADDFTLAWSTLAAVLAVNQTILALFVYRVKFRKLVAAKIALAAVVSLGQLVVCLVLPTVSALVYSQLFASILVTGLLLYRLFAEEAEGFRKPSLGAIAGILKRNYRFPVFAMPSDFINTYATQLPLFIIATQYDEASVAFYALTLRVLAGPVGLMASSILTVFKERAGKDFLKFGNCLGAYSHAFRSLSAMAIVPFVALFYFGEELFVFVFGSDWAQAGRFAKILSPMYLLKFVASPLSYTLYIANRQIHDLFWQITLLGMTLLVFEFRRSLESAIQMYSAGYSFLYVVYLAMSYDAARGTNV